MFISGKELLLLKSFSNYSNYLESLLQKKGALNYILRFLWTRSSVHFFMDDKVISVYQITNEYLEDKPNRLTLIDYEDMLSFLMQKEKEGEGKTENLLF